MPPRRLIAALALALALALAACGRAAIPANSAATVNGRAVPVAPYDALVAASKYKVGRIGIPVNWSNADGQKRLAALQAQALKQVVRNEVIAQLARERRIAVTDDELAQALGQLEAAYGGAEGFTAQLASEGLSRDDFGALYHYTLLDRRMREADPQGYPDALDRAIQGAKVRAYVGPCATDQQYPRCLGDS